MRPLLLALVVVIPIASACVRVDSGAYLCDSHGACPSGFACVNDRCVTSSSSEGEGEGSVVGEGEGAVGEGEGAVGEGEGAVGEGEGVVGEGEGEGSADGFASHPIGTFDDAIEDIAMVDVNDTVHIAVWSHASSPAAVERLRDITCTGACTNAGDWHAVVVDENIPVTAPLRPSVGVDANGHAIVAYARAGSVGAAVCTGDCTQGSAWTLTTVALNTKAPRITADASTVFSCSTLAGNALIESRCTSACDQQASWTSTTLAASCDDVTGAASDGARFDVTFTKAGAASIAECTSDCASASSWSSPVKTGETTTDERCRLLPAGGAALYDLGTARLAACSPCSAAPFKLASIDGVDGVAADLTVGLDGSLHVIATDASGFADHACASLGVCSIGPITVTPSTTPASFVASAVDSAGQIVVASAHGNALTWSVEAP